MDINKLGQLNYLRLSEVGPTDGLIGWWKLNGDALDSSGNENNGTLVNSPVLTKGVKNLAYSFNGTTNYVNIPHSTILEPSEITVAAWINMDVDAPTTRNIFLTKWYGYSCEIEATTRKPYFRTNGAGDTPVGNPITLGEWYFFVGTFKQDEGVKYYGNGVLETSLSTTNSIAYSGNGVLNIGRYAGGVYFKGKIDDVRIYNRALTPEEINILYNIGMNNSLMQIADDGTLYITNELREV